MSVLPLLCKVLERQAFNELCNYLTEHDLDTENQSGFPKYHSCQSLLIKVTDFLLGSIDSGKIAAWLSMIFLRKAFDLVDHQILLEKVELYDLGTTVVTWFQSNPISATDIFKSKSVKFFPPKRHFNMI